jgi:hypothetical protein
LPEDEDILIHPLHGCHFISLIYIPHTLVAAHLFILAMGANMETKTAVSDMSKGHREARNAQVTSVLPDGDVPYTDHEMDDDERVITALGYKQEFKREFSLWTTFCVSFAVLGLLPSFASTLWYGEYPQIRDYTIWYTV